MCGLFSFSARGQVATDWQAYPAFNEGVSVATGPDRIWAATRAGVFSYAPSTGEYERFTGVNGLHGSTLTSIGVHPDDASVWIGFTDGVFQRLDSESGAFSTFFDIERVTQFSSTSINRIRFRGDSVLVATDFGLVVFDAESERVATSVARFEELETATPVRDVLVAPLPSGEAGLWVGTEGGLVRAPADAPNLTVPSLWVREDSLAGDVTSLGLYRGNVVAGAGPPDARDAYERMDDDTWQRRFFVNNEILALYSYDDFLLGVDRFMVRQWRPGQNARNRTDAASRIRDFAVGPNGVWAIDEIAGLFPVSIDPNTDGLREFDYEPFTPSGPYTNAIRDIAIEEDGSIWVTSRRVAGDLSACRFDGVEWTCFLSSDSGLDFPQRGSAGIVTAKVMSDGTFLGGSWGDGMVQIPAEGDVVTFRDDNSTLSGIPTAEEFIVVASITEDDAGLRWIGNGLGESPLHIYDTEGEWTAIDMPAEVPNSTIILDAVFDDFGQLWMAFTDQNEGLAVYDPGSDPFSTSDDRGRHFRGSGTSGNGLPHPTPTAVAKDAEGRIWIGTERGIAFVFSPGSVFSGDTGVGAPQWPIREGSDPPSYLLRDVLVQDMAVDPAGRIWVATTTGAFLLNKEGTQEELILTAENSPLPSNDVSSIEVDERSGRVYLVTGGGLYSFAGDAKGPVETAEDLQVAPNPYRPGEHSDGVLVSGLVARTNVRILTLSGEAVHSREVSGGSFRWDGRDDRTGEFVTSGVYIVAAAGENGEGTAYGKIAVIR